jgi:Tfp pilus assembly protein PilP
MSRTVLCFTLMALALVQGAEAQSGVPATQPPAAAPSTPAASPPVEQPSGWSYDPEGRRDPFLSLLGRGNDPGMSGSRPPGVAGLLIADVTVKGILRAGSGFLAMIQASDSKTYIVRAGDRLFDGSVKSILQDKVIFSQDVNDPLSLVKQREIPKAVRSAEGRGAPPSF